MGKRTLQVARQSATAAAVNAASVVAQVDTQGGLLSAAALDERVAALSPGLPVAHWRWTA